MTADTKYRDNEQLHQQDYDAYSISLQVLRNSGSVEVQHRRLMSSARLSSPRPWKEAQPSRAKLSSIDIP